MKLHDLTPGQRFEFIDKHRGKVFKIVDNEGGMIGFIDVATGDNRVTSSNRKTFRMDVLPVTTERVITLTERETELLTTILGHVYKYEAEMGATEELKAEINRLYLKIKGNEQR